MSESDRRTLYRVPQKGKIAGVCAGVADFFNFEVWLVRVVALSIFLLGGSGVIFVIYIAMWMILDVKPKSHQFEDNHKEIEIKKKVWQSGLGAKQALHDVNSQFSSLELRLRKLETHVTSDTFDLKRQINNL
ncbi:envelope stress response membrane protein PspC [Shewanella gaetbuli]|uniref:Envelope stress response membrane protein PspC n=1 Tax=Shewanella gaetbuli TaxID=220752 RepID=A0A9X1ZQV9_9GAMM|nr:envelope stress response membrane protein PspC [Shewanella gaetbuli]MCL1143917.1 envelope stress response membrane protein PspC [Shewanella gaetbuli]